MGLTLDRVGEIDRVGKVHGALSKEGLEEVYKGVFVRIVDLSLAHRENLGRDNLVDHLSLEPAHGLGLVDDDDILVWGMVRTYPRCNKGSWSVVWSCH